MTVYDLTAWDCPQWLGRKNVLQLRQVLPPALKAATRVVTCSGYTAQRLTNVLQIDPEKIDVVPLAVDSCFSPGDTDGTAARLLGTEEPFILAVGTLQPRKNIEGALHAFERLAQTGSPHHLAVVGARGWLDEALVERLKNTALAERVHVTGAVNDAELVDLYRAADCLVFPSRYEGFGLPPLEAMACGTPVVCSDRTSLPEVVGDAALLFDPDDQSSLDDAMSGLLGSRGSEALRTRLSTAGVQRAQTFDWTRTTNGFKASLALAASQTS